MGASKLFSILRLLFILDRVKESGLGYTKKIVVELYYYVLKDFSVLFVWLDDKRQ